MECRVESQIREGGEPMDARSILSRKGERVFTISPRATIREGMSRLIQNRIGSLLVIDDDEELVGIITERDIFRLTFENDGKVMDIPVGSVMTRDLIIALPTDSLDYLRGLITENRIRHLPVMDDGKLVGLVSIGDVLRTETNEMAVENRYLKDYINGTYPG
jgi:CBS domain-containing protein